MRNIPLYIMHGQLGAGKTTILTSLITRPEFANVRIIENEFAGHSVDGSRLHEDHPHLNIYEISGTCVCCTGSDALMKTLVDLADKDQKDMPVVIETTGAVDAARLLKSLLLDPMFHERFVLKTNILVIDALAVHHQTDLLARLGADIVLADSVILTKVDLLAKNDANALIERCAGIAEHKLVIANQGALPQHLTFANARSRAEDGLIALADTASTNEHQDLSWKALMLPQTTTEALIEALTKARAEGATILRVKGTFNDHGGQTWRVDGTEYLTESVLATTLSEHPMLVLIGKNLPLTLSL